MVMFTSESRWSVQCSCNQYMVMFASESRWSVQCSYNRCAESLSGCSEHSRVVIKIVRTPYHFSNMLKCRTSVATHSFFE